jgi:serine/threonine-protein kinase HipA
MNRCPITYGEADRGRYSERGLKMLASGLSGLETFNYTAEQQRNEAYHRASKMSIQGVQPKVSAILNIRNGRFQIVDKGGRYILKPQHEYYPQLPENEDLTMRLAKIAGLEVPLHGMIWTKDDSLTYFIKRFDRKGQKDKVPVEDFAQLAGLSRDTKYDYSMEKLVVLINRYCTFPAVEKVKLFRLTLFNFIIGNDDMHLKNFSIINKEKQILLSPCYDLVNTVIEYKEPQEEIALPIRGRKNRLTREDIIDYFGKGICGLTDKTVDSTLEDIIRAKPEWTEEILNSFLSPGMQEKYNALIASRFERLGIS